jgi:hypothetical protein
MNHKYEEIEIPENSTGFVYEGKIFVTNFEVGVDLVIAKIGTVDHAGQQYDLRVGYPITYDGGENGKFEVHLIAIKEGNLAANIPASAMFRITRLL